MQRVMYKSKISHATVTGTELEYEGSIGIDRDLMEAADLLPGEQVQVVNINNGARLITYVIEEPSGSRVMLLNGPAARMAQVGDKIMVISYCVVSDEEARSLKPKLVSLSEGNRR
ncbi:MAG: aspartate 1-decarboxylase [Candidatus Nealsonbacteria bacterium]|nr:aspartate 1-decarboxylase [Candidatus Nealsonbacteria bacterium]